MISSKLTIVIEGNDESFEIKSSIYGNEVIQYGMLEMARKELQKLRNYTDDQRNKGATNGK